MNRLPKRTSAWAAGVLAAASCSDSLVIGVEPVSSAHVTRWEVAGRNGTRLADEPVGLRVSFLNGAGQPVDRVRVPCGENCTQIFAQVSGGSGRYQYEWEDGSSLSERSVCLSTGGHIALRVTDLGVSAGFSPPAAPDELLIPLQVESTCDGGLPAATLARLDGGPNGTALHCIPPPDPPCLVAPEVSLPSEVTVDVQGGTTHFFAGGAVLPAGRYRVSYVDGCLTAGTVELNLGVGWSIQSTKKMLGTESCYLISDSGVPLMFTPGTEGAFVGPDLDAGQGAFPTYDECVAANCGIEPVDFDFPGGRLGVARDGGTVLGAIDDLGGEAVGGRSPTFRLTRLDACL